MVSYDSDGMVCSNAAMGTTVPSVMPAPSSSSPPSYRMMNVRVTPQARAAWQAWAQHTGCSLSALMEAIGQMLAESAITSSEAGEVVRRAREIDFERRRRGAEDIG